MKTTAPFLCSVGLHRWRPAGHLGLGASPLRACTKCPSQHIIYWGGSMIDVTPGEHRILSLSERGWFKLLSSLTAGALIGLAFGVFLLNLVGNAVGAPIATAVSGPPLAVGVIFGAVAGALFAALRLNKRHNP